MLDVTAALDTPRSTAIAGREGRKMLVDRSPIAAKAQITALAAIPVRCSGFSAAALPVTTSLLIAVPSLSDMQDCRPDRQQRRPDAGNSEPLLGGVSS
nr:hypothetical protein [Bradyrhizobium diazoefficiens]